MTCTSVNKSKSFSYGRSVHLLILSCGIQNPEFDVVAARNYRKYNFISFTVHSGGRSAVEEEL